ncbi:hypothetical protein Goarm_013073 [Gossypium armourianum]|uniref:RRM domain-containing protein n=1 Tax=Gossypium armourianum TaxID=34283 RepID=A0A7J9J1Y9_9ROSI|nr:hypothetical protein [Gossypium armourianum]
MNDFGYTVEVTGLPTKATEKDVYDFFAFSGTIEHVEIVRSGEYASTAYVTFKNAYSQETAVLLSVCIPNISFKSFGVRQFLINVYTYLAGGNMRRSLIFGALQEAKKMKQAQEYVTSYPFCAPEFDPCGSFALDVVKAMLGKGYVLGKDALSKAKTLDESHQVSATAAAKVAELSERIGLTDKICVGVDAVRSVDERYHVSENTKSAISAAGRTAAAAANAVVSSSYFSKGALWVSGALDRAAKAAADIGNRGVHQ